MRRPANQRLPALPARQRRRRRRRPTAAHLRALLGHARHADVAALRALPGDNLPQHHACTGGQGRGTGHGSGSRQRRRQRALRLGLPVPTGAGRAALICPGQAIALPPSTDAHRKRRCPRRRCTAGHPAGPRARSCAADGEGRDEGGGGGGVGTLPPSSQARTTPSTAHEHHPPGKGADQRQVRQERVLQLLREGHVCQFGGAAGGQQHLQWFRRRPGAGQRAAEAAALQAASPGHRRAVQLMQCAQKGGVHSRWSSSRPCAQHPCCAGSSAGRQRDRRAAAVVRRR